MGIWIRSQDKIILVNAYQIFVASNGTMRVVDVGSEETTFVGKYSTKERAVEVLDEIQKLICYDGYMQDSEFIVYQMPTE